MPTLKVTRHPGERIYIGDDVVVEIAQVEGKKVTVSVRAPASVAVWREEIYLERKRREGGGHADIHE